mmetsp:Transcript_47070/g.150888  ORF Transcript_47070/g.150888 Transcript_47070/m.150888 type:complete len:178 (-) Transcript_47070:107-640(-)
MLYKDRVEYLCRLNNDIKMWNKAIQIIQRACRRFMEHSGRTRELRRQEEVAREWTGLVEILQLAGFPEYESVMRDHQMTLGRMDELTQDSLCLMGIAMGPAVEIIRVFRSKAKNRRRTERSRKAPLPVLTPKTPGPVTDFFGVVEQARHQRRGSHVALGRPGRSSEIEVLDEALLEK